MGILGVLMVFGSLIMGAIISFKLMMWASTTDVATRQERAAAGSLMILFFTAFVGCMVAIGGYGYNLADQNLCICTENE